MTEGIDDPPRSFQAFRWNSHGAVIVGVLGISLWMQLALPSMVTELRASDGQRWMVLLNMIPLFVLAGALTSRNGAVALLAFPLSLMPGLASLPPIERGLMFSVWAMLRVCGSAAVYLAVASAWVASRETADDDPAPVAIRDRRGGYYRQYVTTRAVPMVLLFVVPTYAGLFDPAVVSTISQNYPDNEAVAQTFIALLVFFFWSIVAYSQFLLPALNLEYDRRRERKQANRLRKGLDQRERLLRAGLEIGIVILVVGGFALFSL